MTHNLFYRPGTRLRLPSGRQALLVRWTVRPRNLNNQADGNERIAVVQLVGGVGSAEFAEAFMRKCVVLS